MTDSADPSGSPSFRWDVLRSDDLLMLGFSFYNLVPEGGVVGAPLVRLDASRPAYMVIDLGPQHIAEATTPQAPQAPPTIPPDPQPLTIPVRHRLAGRSRLAFQLPDAVTSIPFTLKAFLDWSAWHPSLVPVVVGPTKLSGVPALRLPLATETAIELPYRLVLSPDIDGGWAHSTVAQMFASRAELWHTRLIRPPGTISDGDPVVRAVWSPDVAPAAVPVLPGPTFPDPAPAVHLDHDTLLSSDRNQLVHLTSNWVLQSDFPVRPATIPAEFLALSALGGWLRVHAAFPEPLPAGFDLVDWRHVATEARDHYVKRVRAGTLFPFRHRAHLVQIAERKVIDTANGPVAALLSREFIVVQQPVRDYSREHWVNGGREFPFTSVRITTLVTPDLADEQGFSPAGSRKVSVTDPPGTQSRPFPFHLIATDISGATVEFTAGMLWIDDRDRALGIAPAFTLYHGDASYRTSTLAGQLVAYAPVPAVAARGLSSAGATRLRTEVLRFEALPVDDGADFLPRLDTADIRVPAIEHLAGPQTVTTMRPADAYLAHGLDDDANNAPALFLQVVPVDPAVPLPKVSLPPKLAGGIINPELALAGLSAHLGPVSGDLPKLAAGVLDPQAVLGGAALPKLFGVIELWKLITTPPALTIPPTLDLGQLPQTVTRQEPPIGVPTKYVTQLSWKPKVSTKSAELAKAGLEGGPKFALSVDATVETFLDGSEPTARVDARLDDFTFVLPPGGAAVITVQFAAVVFHAQTGKKGDISVSLAGGPDALQFEGALSFLNELRRFIPSDGFSDPPAISITDQGITTGYSLGLPPLAIGVFSLTDVRLGAQLQLPFTAGKPRLRLNFCERDHPCMLTVSMLGGGAFLGLAVGLDGIEMIEASIDFGGAFCINLGVASGSVSAVAGIYFRYDHTADTTEIDGFLRINGSVNVLGLITVSVEFNLHFGYVAKPGGAIIQGEATLTVNVDLTLWSFSVSLSVHRSFGSGPGDPTFAALMPDAGNWADYAAAFAA